MYTGFTPLSKTRYIGVIYASNSHVGGVGSIRSWNAMQNEFGGKLPTAVIVLSSVNLPNITQQKVAY